ncbi:sulfurtransferase TusA family protein [bacterium]|nr:sulfurtransferase TusA family protein [bacterium]
MLKIEIDEYLDLRGETCPFTFVKTKLVLEKMAQDKVLLVILDDGGPIVNVPRSCKEEGHEVFKVEREHNFFKVYLRKDGLR